MLGLDFENKMSDFLKILEENRIIIDGGMGTMIQNLDCTDDDFGGSDFRMLSDLLTFSRPEDLKNIHIEYYKAGANAVETNTFGASPLRLEEFDFSKLDLDKFPKNPYDIDLKSISIEKMAYYMSRYGAEVACKAREEYRSSKMYDGRPLFVLGSIGPSNWVLSATQADLRVGTWEKIVDNFYHQGLGMIDGGVDVFLHETQQDILELKAAIAGSLKAMRERKKRLPIMAQITVDQFSKMQIFNTDIVSAAVTTQGTGIDVFGINCSIGPDLMKPTVEKLDQYVQLPISVIPNAGLPVSEDGQTVFKMGPDGFRDHLMDMASNYRINIMGGCCGTTPEHIHAVAQAAKNLPKPKTIS